MVQRHLVSLLTANQVSNTYAKVESMLLSFSWKKKFAGGDVFIMFYDAMFQVDVYSCLKRSTSEFGGRCRGYVWVHGAIVCTCYSAVPGLNPSLDVVCQMGSACCWLLASLGCLNTEK